MPALLVTRLGVACSLLLLMAVPGAGRAATASPVQPCTQFAASPNFAKDKTAFCAGHFRSPGTGQTTGFHIARTTDGGRTWTTMPAAGLASNYARYPYADVGFFALSPLYAADKTMLIQIEGLGLFESKNDGMSFTLVDPVVGRSLAVFISSARGSLALPEPLAGAAAVGDHAALVMAIPAGQDGQPNQSALIDPLTHAHTPIVGTPVRDKLFAISDTYAQDGAAFAVADSGVGASAQVKIYRCDATFRCSQLLYAFPKRWTFDRIWLSRDFRHTRRIFASVTSLAGGETLWWSRDAGKTWARWTAAERLLLPAVKGGSRYVLNPGPGRLLYLWAAASFVVPANDPPVNQLFRSRNNGDSWERVSYRRSFWQKGPSGTMPEHSMPFGGTIPAGTVTVAGPGPTVFLLGSWSGPYTSLYCSWNGGVHWGRACK